MTFPVVRLAGLTFNDGPDGDGDEFFVSDLSGWDCPDVQQVLVDRPISAGAVIARSRIGTWTMTMAGWVVAASSMGAARRKLGTALLTIVSADGTLSVDEDDGTYELTVRLAQRPRTHQESDLAISFEADLIAVTPTKEPGAS